MSDDKQKDVDQAFMQLDGALCIWARAKGERPLSEYFTKSTCNVRTMFLDGQRFQVVITVADPEPEESK